MKILLLAFSVIAFLLAAARAETGMPAVAVHIEKHAAWDCNEKLPSVRPDELVTTYSGVGKIDAFVVFYGLKEARGLAFGLDWPEGWGKASWHDCGDLRMGTIVDPGDMTSIVWQECRTDPAYLIAGWVTLTVTSPGAIEVTPSTKEEIIAVLDCDPVAARLSEAFVSLKAGVGGVKGDPPSRLTSAENRTWSIRPDSTGDEATINDALRRALPGDTVMVAGGTYREHLVLRRGIALLGSWNEDFTARDLGLFPSVIDAAPEHHEGEEHPEEGEHHTHDGALKSAVEIRLGADSTTVLDGFVITGGRAKQGGGMTLRNGAKPALRNLVIHSNNANYGGGIFCHSSSPRISNCLMAGNEGNLGGAIYCSAGSSPVITGTTIVANRAQTGAAVAVAVGSSPVIERSIIADHPDPSPIFVQDKASSLTMTCCDLWGNGNPQYGGIGKEVLKLRDNISADPAFANAPAMDFTPAAGSPVLAVPDCGAIGTEHGKIPERRHHME